MTTKTTTVKKSSSKKTSKSTAKKTTAKKKSPAVGGVSRARAKTAAKSPAAPASKPKPARANVARPAPKPSAVRASLIVLADAPAEGMTTRELVTAMAERKLWTSPGGKTPEATLYASIVREIARKGEASRFKKVARGRFVLNAIA